MEDLKPPKPLPAIPVESQLWDCDDIALFLRRKSPKEIVTRITHEAWFPAPIHIATNAGRAKRPLYRASEVIEAVLQFQERRAA